MHVQGQRKVVLVLPDLVACLSILNPFQGVLLNLLEDLGFLFFEEKSQLKRLLFFPYFVRVMYQLLNGAVSGWM